MEVTHTANKRSVRFRFAAILFGILFLFSTWLVITQEWVRQVDVQSMIWLQQTVSTSADSALSLLQLPGSSEATAVVLFFIFLWMLKRKKRIFFPVSFVILVILLELTGKLLINHPRPPRETLRYIPLIQLPASSYFQLYNSYPSGHVGRSAFTSVILLLLLRTSKVSRKKKILGSVMIGAYFTVIFFSRVSLGIHWISDVTGGLLLGVAVAALALSFWQSTDSRLA